MNKAELIDEIQKIKGENCTKACAERSLDAVLQAIISGVAKTGSVQLIGFGTFSVTTRAARMGVNPKTKTQIHIPASKSVKFRVGTKFKSVAK
ncbi:MAG: HU family DNA-binding protein [Puniceicoccales bacterium]|jgi:nucleoid DNA-binding protein|nr:HU family DNA-binding protein [Puniceicoccales bacterium]